MREKQELEKLALENQKIDKLTPQLKKVHDLDHTELSVTWNKKYFFT